MEYQVIIDIGEYETEEAAKEAFFSDYDNLIANAQFRAIPECEHDPDVEGTTVHESDMIPNFGTCSVCGEEVSMP